VVVTPWLYTAFIALIGIERLVELVVSKRNAKWSFANGGKEIGLGHFPFMVVLHTGFLFGMVAEVWLLGRLFTPVIGYSMLTLALLTQGLRWWCILTLGKRWNTRVIIVPGLPRVTGGPYRFLSHPNYVAVILEGIALPLIHGAWLSALLFSALDGVLLWWRISVEEAALDEMELT
jgi:methyltransferase